MISRIGMFSIEVKLTRRKIDGCVAGISWGRLSKLGWYAVPKNWDIYIK
jgi:hypothetical protein